MTKLDAKKELNSTSKNFATLDAPSDSYNIEKTRKGVMPQ
jgi:hypothetical protein